MMLRTISLINLNMMFPAAVSAAPVYRPTVPLVIEKNDETDVCSNGVISGLNPHGDAFLAIRSGPGVKYRELTRLYNGDQVYMCGLRGDWVGIVWARPWGSGCKVMEPWPKTQPYTGPCNSGWVHRRYVTLWAG
jgi:hypothetical protein